MRLLLRALSCPKGDVAGNLARHRAALAAGAAAGCDLVLLPEMSLTGYLPTAGLALAAEPIAALVAATRGAPALGFGLVEAAGDGGAPYITQVLAAGGELVAVHRKAHLGEGETGSFRPGTGGEPFAVGGVGCAFAVCAEIGVPGPFRRGARLILGPSAPGLYGPRRSDDASWRRGFDWWRGSVRADARRQLRAGQWLAVSTQAGATIDEDFPGWAALVGAGGAVVAELPDWRAASLVVDLPTAPG